MSIRTKLILSYVCLSTLIIVVGLIFYLQLKNLIEPLTPESMPRSVQQLSNAIDKTNFIYQLLYKQQLVENDLKNYVYSNDITSLQNYYMNQALLDQLFVRSKTIDSSLWNELAQPYNLMEAQWSQIILAMQQNNNSIATRLLSDNQYLTSIQNFSDVLNNYYKQYDVISNETSVVTVKLASKNTTALLLDSLNKTVIIFFDAIILSLLLAYFAARTISRPINLLSNDMKRISSENLDSPIHVKPAHYSGEIGDLTRSFILLINKLRTTTVSRDKLLEEIERRKEFEENLRQTSLRLEESNRELDQFAYSASHDLRAPLQGIETLSEWIMEESYEVLPEQSRKHLDLLKKRVHRLDALISGILAYSRVKTSPENLVAIDLNKLLDDIIDNLNVPHNIKIIIDNALPTVTTDQAAITQVFLNLINNAIKFHDKAYGHIHVGCELNDNFYNFHVNDDGPGIDVQHHEKIFDLFHTLQSRDTVESTGIGLAIVKKIVEKHGGMIKVESVIGKGSTFYFTWPKE